MDKVLLHNDVVLTGGEPLADLDALQDILNHIKDGHHVYINTTLPTNETQDIHKVAEVLNRNKDKISCINVSRHLKHYVKECSNGNQRAHAS